MLMANGDYSGEFISCLLRQEFFNVAVQPGQKVSEDRDEVSTVFIKLCRYISFIWVVGLKGVNV